MMQAKCQESFGRNALLAAFRAYGGQPNDVALISDADEIPRAAAMPKVVSMATRAGRKRWPVSLGAVHHFKYSVGMRAWVAEAASGGDVAQGPNRNHGRIFKRARRAARADDGRLRRGGVARSHREMRNSYSTAGYCQRIMAPVERERRAARHPSEDER